MGFFGRHAPYYFWHFAALALITAFFPVWITDLGRNTGELVTLQTLSRICGVVAPLWLIYPLRPMHPGKWLTVTTALCALFGAGMLAFDGTTPFLLLLLVSLGFFFLFSSLLPQVEALTIHGTQLKMARYNYVRVMGSIGFAIASWLTGVALDWWGTDAFPWLMLASLVISLMVGLPMWSSDTMPRPDTLKGLMRQGLGHCGMRWLIIGALLLQGAFACYYTFFALHLRPLGHSSGQIGLYLLIASAAEVVAFLNAHRLMRWRGPIFWIRMAFAMTALRWIGIGFFGENTLLVMLLQSTHAVGFALWHVSSVRLIMDWRSLPGGASNGVAIFNSFGYGVGGIVGTVLAGLAWQLGAGAAVFSLACMMTILAAVLASRALPEEDKVA